MSDYSLVPGALRDIHGIDAAPWWPPGPGWWVLALLAVVILALSRRGSRLHWRWLLSPLRRLLGRLFAPAWRIEGARELRRLRRDLGRRAPAEIATDLSALLRRIAMARFGRAACAGLHGTAWLDWLRSRDPVGFDWPRAAACLLELPYAPPSAPPAATEEILARVIAAALAWTAADEAPPADLAARGRSLL